MSEVTLFHGKNAGSLPIPKRAGGLDAMTKSLMGGSGGGNKRISIRGGIFRLMADGQEVAKNEDRAMEIVMVAAAPHTSRTYYSGTYQEGTVTAPDCWSNDGDTPDARATNKQSNKCANCPMNIAGSGQGTSKACRYSHRLAVLLGNDIENSDVYQLVLPAQSIFGKGETGKMPLLAYAKFLGGNGLTMNSVRSEMRFDTSSATPKLTFRAMSPLSDEEFEIAVEKGESQDAQNAISFNPSTLDGAKPAVVSNEPVRQVKPKAAPVEVAEAEEEPAPVVREKKGSTVAKPQELEDVLAAWGDDDE
jgi:hypothetical protein